MKISINSSSTHAPVLVMQRTFDVPREVVWAALTDPAKVQQWYGGKGYENPICQMDFKAGGKWHQVTRTPDGVEHPLDFEFIEVLEPQRLAWKTVAGADPLSTGPHNHVTTVTLEGLGGQTKWKRVTRFKSYADRDEAKKVGLFSVLAEETEKLNALLLQTA